MNNIKKSIGNQLVLYPTPAVLVGAAVDDKPSWTLVAHTGIVAHDRLLVSLHSSHYINKGIKQTGLLSVNIVTEDILPQTDYCGVVSGSKTDKSSLFDFMLTELGTPIPNQSPLSMECRVEDVYEVNGFDNFICSITGTYVVNEVLDKGGKIDYHRLRPVLFEFPTYQYLRTGDVITKCTLLGKELKKKYDEKKYEKKNTD